MTVLSQKQQDMKNKKWWKDYCPKCDKELKIYITPNLQYAKACKDGHFCEVII